MSNETLWCLVVNFSMFIFLSMRCAFKQCCSVSDQCDEISPLWRINLGIPGNYQLDYNKREFSRKVAFHQLRHFLFLYKIKNSGYLYWSLWSKPSHSPLLGRGPSFLGCFRFQTWTIMIIALGHSPFSRCQPPPPFLECLRYLPLLGCRRPFLGCLRCLPSSCSAWYPSRKSVGQMDLWKVWGSELMRKTCPLSCSSYIKSACGGWRDRTVG